VADIVAESDRLGGLVDDLLALAASERGTLAIERRHIDLAAVARDTVRRAGPLAAERGIDLVGPADGGTRLPVVGDPDRLVQLLLVLVDNASRHSPPGGRVTVTAGEDGRRVASVYVDDQGPGVPTGAREAIFEPFARLPGSRSAADAGSGLGLAIARRIAELHGGTLIATEAPGGGARFVLSLPSGRSAGPATGATGAGVGRGTGAPADDRPAARAPDDAGDGPAIQVP
jgi:two-component system sensor histidine kinase ResE